MNKVIVLGGKGFVASHLPYERVEDRVESNTHNINKLIDRYIPDVIINTIGYCGENNIDDCENDRHRTYTANALIPMMLAGECERLGIRLINIGSGCIFSGKDPREERFSGDRDWNGAQGWNETDKPNPQSFYARTKIADLLLEEMRGFCSLRIRMPVSHTISSRNLLSKITKYNQIVKTANSITFMSDLVRGIDWAIQKNLQGIYHLCHPKSFYHSEFLNEYKKYVPEHTWESITPKQLDSIVAAKRSNCLIDSKKLIKTGFKFCDAKEEMERCIREFVEAKKV